MTAEERAREIAKNNDGDYYLEGFVSEIECAEAIQEAILEERKATEARCKEALAAALKGSQPFIEQKLKEAILEEREACAAIADRYCGLYTNAAYTIAYLIRRRIS